jgi:hypothetical protein
MKKILAIGVILLFIGVAVAPSINQSVATASQDDDLVEVTTQACTHQSLISPVTSYVDALGFLSGRISNLSYGHDDFGDFIAFHAKHMFFLALANPLSCSIVWLFLNKDVQFTLKSPPSGYIGNNSLRIVFNTIVVGPI